MSRNKTYRGQREQKSYKIGCGCFYCTGSDKDKINKIKERIIEKETKQQIK